MIVGCAVLYYLVGSKLIPVPQNTVDLARRFLRGAVLIVIVLAIAKAISIYAIGRLDDAATRFTLRRIEHLLVALVIAVIVIGASLRLCIPPRNSRDVSPCETRRDGI